MTSLKYFLPDDFKFKKVFDLLMGDTGKDLVDKLHRNTKLFRERMTDAGFTLKVGPMLFTITS